MKPAAFIYLAPDSLDEALAHKSEHGEDAKPLAGGQSLIPAMNFRVAQPSILTDLNRIAELDFIREDNGSVSIGAMTRQSAVEKSTLIKEMAPLIHETMPYIAHPQIRNRGTIGGSLAHDDPAAELPVLAIALNAQFKVQDTKGERLIEAKDFFLGFFEVSMKAEELLTEVLFPKFPDRTGWSFQEISRRRGDFAMAGVASVVTLDSDGACEDVRIVLLNVGVGPVEATQAVNSLQGSKITQKTINEAAALAAEKDISPFGNLHATPDYQRHLTKVLVARTLLQAHDRAKNLTTKTTSKNKS
ncbi:MAG: xanthine dehydrogenase family protein subunit M [Chloroflexota bacterium]